MANWPQARLRAGFDGQGNGIEWHSQRNLAVATLRIFCKRKSLDKSDATDAMLNEAQRLKTGVKGLWVVGCGLWVVQSIPNSAIPRAVACYRFKSEP